MMIKDTNPKLGKDEDKEDLRENSDSERFEFFIFENSFEIRPDVHFSFHVCRYEQRKKPDWEHEEVFGVVPNDLVA